MSWSTEGANGSIFDMTLPPFSKILKYMIPRQLVNYNCSVSFVRGPRTRDGSPACTGWMSPEASYGPLQVLYRSFRLDMSCPCKVSEGVYFSPIHGPCM